MSVLIKNFGHFWSREDVNWGTRGKNNRGSLKGYVIRTRKRQVTDFRDQKGIYILFDRNREPIYLGQTGSREYQRLFHRLHQHLSDHLRGRWTHFSWFGFESVHLNKGNEEDRPLAKVGGVAFPNGVAPPAGEFLDELEAILLQSSEPRLNKQGPKWRGSVEYLQHVPARADEGENILLAEVADRLALIEAKLN